MKREWIRWTGYGSPLGGGIQQYLEAKRSFGRRFGNEERALHLFDRFLAQQRVTAIEDISPAVVDAFLCSRPRRVARSYNDLQGTVRRLLDWLLSQGVAGVVPYRGRPRRETGRRVPVLFTDAQARLLLDAAARLPDDPHVSGPRGRGQTYRLVFAVLYGLGLRVGEVSRLEVGDVDLGRRTLVVRRTKFGKDRLVPFGPRLAGELGTYLAKRRRLSPDRPLFSVRGRTAISTNSIRKVFQRLCREVGIGPSASGSAPRVHDMRHSFAVATLLHWYEEGVDPGDRLHQLSTFLGHVNPAATAVYITITSELLQEAKRRFARVAAAALPEVAS